ncbi:MAG: M23 family metallopeptidase [Chloroflexi bacterium]|nr:MAG: M23 family metallopeptidase [Chloroflexota bacterium]
MGTGTPTRRSQATPSPRRIVQRNVLLLGQRLQHTGRRVRSLAVRSVDAGSLYLADLVGVRGLRLALNTSVAVLVLSLPFAATSASRASTGVSIAPDATVVAASPDAVRAQPLARGVITTGRSPQTAIAAGTHPIQDYIVNKGDTLATIANFYDVSVEALAFANGITEADAAKALRINSGLRIPPGEGALYTVAQGDTYESVAARFKVDQSVIMSYNRLYFEPEHFAPGQLIFVRGAELPSLKEPERPIVAARPLPQPPASISGRLALPVAGRITQYFWWGHTGVDVAAPYGTGIGASEDGVVSAAGWVAVGGLRVCVKHAEGLETCYYHTSNVFVSPGQVVARGQIIAAIGLTGVTTGPHVHWECKLSGQFVNCLGLT